MNQEEINFLQNLQLQLSEFDPNYTINFPQLSQGTSLKRGGLPYYKPVLGKRFGIKVSNLYENGDWLKKDGNKNEWAVVFHGVRTPALKVASQKTGKMVSVMRNIMDGRQKGTMLRQGPGQGCAANQCIKSSLTFGNGIYVSPYFLSCLLDYSAVVPGSKFHIILQCRARPSSIKISSARADICVVNKREDLRPYGIILFTAQDVAQIRKRGNSSLVIHKAIYSSEFTAQAWKEKYEKQYSEFHKIK